MADRSQYGYVSIELTIMKKIDEGAVLLNIKADRSQYGYVGRIKVFCKFLFLLFSCFARDFVVSIRGGTIT